MTHMRIIGLVIGVLLLVVGCGSGGSGGSSGAGGSSGSAPAAATNQIVIKNFMFMPMTLTVAPGTKITVSNEDSATHTLTATDKSFDSGDIAPGKTATITAPTKPGTYGYLCDIHQYMTGMIKVT
jgi:plastocyanin